MYWIEWVGWKKVELMCRGVRMEMLQRLVLYVRVDGQEIKTNSQMITNVNELLTGLTVVKDLGDI